MKRLHFSHKGKEVQKKRVELRKRVYSYSEITLSISQMQLKNFKDIRILLIQTFDASVAWRIYFEAVRTATKLMKNYLWLFQYYSSLITHKICKQSFGTSCICNNFFYRMHSENYIKSETWDYYCIIFPIAVSNQK